MGKPIAVHQLSDAICLEMGINGAEHVNRELLGVGNPASCFPVAVINCY